MRTPVTEEELSTEFVHGTRALVQCGILDPDLVLDIEGRLLDYHDIHLTSNLFSGWYYRHIIFPEPKVGIDISQHHLRTQERMLHQLLKSNGLLERVSREQLRSLVLASVIMHEYGHALDVYFQIRSAGELSPNDLGNHGKTIHDVALDINEREDFWGIWDKADKPILDFLVKFSEDTPNRRRALEEIDSDQLRDSFAESIARGVENASMIAMLQEFGLKDDQLTIFKKAIASYYEESFADLIFFFRVARQYGYDQSTYAGLIHRVQKQFKKFNIPLDRLPYYGLSPLEIGYNLPLKMENLKNFVQAIWSEIDHEDADVMTDQN